MQRAVKDMNKKRPNTFESAGSFLKGFEHFIYVNFNCC